MRLLIVILFFLSFSFCSAQEYVYTIDEYGIEDGLINKQINTLFEDENGILWLGTTKGILRFDGEEFMDLIEKRKSLLRSSITRITQDDEGILWLWDDTNKEFLFLDPLSYNIETTKEKFGDEFPDRFLSSEDKPGFIFSNSRIFKSSQNEIYFSTLGLDFFYKYHSSKGFEKIVVPTKNICNKGIKLFGIINDTIHISVDSVINLKYINGFKSYNSTDSLNLQSCDELLPNFQSHIPNEEIISLFSRLNTLFSNYSVKSISSITYDPNTEIIYHFDRHRWITLNPNMDTIFTINAENLKNPDLFINESCRIDKNGNVWVFGHFGLVRIKVTKNKFNKILHKKNGGNIAIRGITSDDEHLYVCGENTASVYKLDKQNLQLEKSALFDEYNRTVNIKSNNELLIGGHYAFTINKNLENKIHHESIPKDQYKWGENYGVWSSFIDAEETIWIGKGGYLAKKEKNESSFKMYAPTKEFFDKSDRNNCILSIIPQGKDSLWVCSESGLILIDTQNDKVLHAYSETENEYLPASKFYHIYKEDNNIYWLGTDRGLIKWEGPSNPDEYKVYNVNTNLSNDVIYAVYEDDFDRLWLSSNYGIMRFDKKTEIVKTYLEKDGISHYEFNRTSHHKDEKGNIYFGGINGATTFHPRDFYTNDTSSTSLLISKFEIFDGTQDELVNKTAELIKSQTITVNPSDKYFRLSFSFPSYEGKNNKIFAWKIDGLQEDWTYQTTNNIEINILPYGDYNLLVKARTRESSWSENVLKIAIEVVKPFYKTLWFALLCLCALIGSIILFFMSRTRYLKIKIEQATKKILSDKLLIEEQKEDLEALDKAKTQFFTNVSHELRTPLTLMKGPISRLQKNGGLEDENLKLLNLLHKNSSQLEKLVNEILDLSKLENKKMVLSRSTVQIQEFLTEIISKFYPFAENKGLNIKEDIDFTESDAFNIDKPKLEKVLNNLLANAVKFTPVDGEIHIKATKVNNSLHFTITDTGRGIHEKDIDKIFDRYYQAKHSNTKAEGGTGIGLSLSKELITLMDGEISVKSQIDKGSEFHFQIPALYSENEIKTKSKPQNKEVQDIIAPAIDKSLKSILIVEDNKDLQEYLEIILKEYNIIIADNGKEASSYLANNSAPDLILSDIMMPVMDGMELLNHLKTSDQYRHIPVIMLTAKNNKSTKIKALRYGIDDYLNKPFDEEELLVRIQNLLNFRSNIVLNNPKAKTESTKQTIISEKDYAWLESVETYVLENLTSHVFSVQKLAEDFTMSESTLLRQIKRITGLSTKKYIQELKLNHAKEIISNDDSISVSQVAHQLGYKDPSSFSRIYKARFGVAPSQA